MESPIPAPVAEIVETVPFYDTDCGGVVSNIAYLRYIEKARTLLFEQLDLPASGMMETGLFPAVVRSEVDYRSPARLGETLRVRATLAGVEKARVTCRFEIHASGEGTAARLAAEAVQIVVLVQMPACRPKRIPSQWFVYKG